MNATKKILCLSSAFCILINAVGISASAKSPALNEQTMDVKFRQVIEVHNVLPEEVELMDKAIEAAATTGWTYNEAEQRFERLLTYNNIDVTVSGSEVELDMRGRARVLTASDEVVEVNVYEPIMNKTYTQLVSGDSIESAVVIDLDISSMFTMDSGNGEYDNNPKLRATTTYPYWNNGEQGVTGKALHCNRFNGYKGNGCYYSNSASKQALINFFGSDCDHSLNNSTKCISDFLETKYCAASPSSKQGRCSRDMSHSVKFHWHTTYDG